MVNLKLFVEYDVDGKEGGGPASFTIQAASLLLHWDECSGRHSNIMSQYYVSEQGASIWITGARVIKIRAEGGNNVREMPWRNKSVCLLFYPLHFILSSRIIWWGNRGRHWPCPIYICTLLRLLLVLLTLQRQGNVIQLLAKTSSSMCILWTV